MTPSTTTSPDLNPTLWRTCRVLANATRLRILAHLFQHPEQSVSAVAEDLDLTTGTASQYLRLLNSRGLVQTRRSGRFVRYRVAPNRSIPGTDDLVRALRVALKQGSDPVANVFRLITGFTHPRRIRIVKALAERAMSFPELNGRTRISADALRRHLHKLERRGFLAPDSRAASRGYRLQVPRSNLGRVLVRLARES